jgi:hypothetical protein
MKKVLITLIVVVVSLNLTAQKMHTVAWYNWSNPVSYQLSPSPYITGYGYHSDSLSKAFNGTTFYVYNEEYYPIKSWADYYLWYVNKYWYKFHDSELYEYYYHIKDDFGMASYIAGRSYQGRYYPSRICISFINKEVEINRLYANSRYIASNDKQVKKFKKLEKLAYEPTKNQHKIVDKTDIVKKPVNLGKKNINEMYSSGKSKHKIIKKEAKPNKYQHVNYRSNTNYRRLNGNTTHSVNRSSSNINNTSRVSRTSSVGRSTNVNNNSAKTKLPE